MVVYKKNMLCEYFEKWRVGMSMKQLMNTATLKIQNRALNDKYYGKVVKENQMILYV